MNEKDNKNINYKLNLRKIIIELSRSFFKIRPFSIAVVSTILIQLVASENWLNHRLGNFDRIFLFSIIILAFNWFFNSNLYGFRRIKEVTPLDLIIYETFLITIVNFILFKFRKIPNQRDEMFWLFFLTFISFYFLIWRICIIISSSFVKTDRNPAKSLTDLKTLFKGPFSWKIGDKAILVDERPVDYDLFNRQNIKRQIIDAINHFNYQHAYVVGLVGRWGSGKTTILNLVKKDYKNSGQNNLVFMHAPGTKEQDIDLWLIGSQEELIKSLYDTFLCNMGINYNSYLNNNLLKSVSKIVSGIPTIGNIISPLIFDIGSYEDINLLKKKLSKYILSTGKQYVLCIENLDRAEDKQIILLLKLISTLFDLPNVTYVLLYSDQRLNNILKYTKNINSSYANKVINQEIRMPTLIESNICYEILENLLRSYGFSGKKLIEFDFVVNFIANNLSSIRDLKRIINSVFTILAIRDRIRLDLPQLIAIQYIHFSNFSLYEEIRTHENEFVEKEINNSAFNGYQLNEQTKKYFENLKEKYEKYANLLNELFPKFRLLNQKNHIIRSYNEVQEELKKEAISTHQYFVAYFTLNENDFVVINQQARNFINKIRLNGNISKNWHALLNNKSSNQLIVELDYFIGENDGISSEKREKLAESMFNSIVDENANVDEYRILSLVVKLIGEANKVAFDKFRDLIIKRFDALEIVEVMSNYMSHQVGGISNNFAENTKKMLQIYNHMCDEILNSGNRINLYKSPYYRKLNILGFEKYREENDDEKIEKYIGHSISPTTIYLIMRDAIDYTGHNPKNIIGGIFADVLKNNEEEVDRAFEQNPPKTDNERFLCRIYKKFIQKNRDEYID